MFFILILPLKIRRRNFENLNMVHGSFNIQIQNLNHYNGKLRTKKGDIL